MVNITNVMPGITEMAQTASHVTMINFKTRSGNLNAKIQNLATIEVALQLKVNAQTCRKMCILRTLGLIQGPEEPVPPVVQ
jgi:hypothetical protein